MFLTADEIVPAYGSGVLLLIAAAAVAVLLVLIMRFKLHAFVALVLVSFLTALATKVPFAEVVPTLLSGFGSTLASVALLVGFGAMIGRMLEVTGGAQVLADTLINRFGPKRAPLALGVASLGRATFRRLRPHLRPAGRRCLRRHARLRPAAPRSGRCG
jgi:GntP family gluconate:H+ symporter